MSGMRAAFARLVEEFAEQDERLTVIVGDISHGILKQFSTRFPSRYFNIGILEPAMIGVASGMSKVGLRPVVHTIAPFLVERTFEQLKLDFAYQQLDVSLVSVGGAFDYSKLGVSHHSYSDVALVSQLDESKIFLPGSVEEFEVLFAENYALPGIKYFRLSEFPHGVKIDLPETLGHSGIKVKPGEDLTLVCTGRSLENCVAAAKKLENEIDCGILYFPTLKPFDESIVREELVISRNFVSVEELSNAGGLFDRVLRASIDIGGIRGSQIAIRNMVREYGTFEDLEGHAGLDADSIVASVQGLFASSH